MHRVPAQQPFDLLVYLLRTIMTLYAGRFAFSWWVYWQWWRFVEEVEDAGAASGCKRGWVVRAAWAGGEWCEQSGLLLGTPDTLAKSGTTCERAGNELAS